MSSSGQSALTQKSTPCRFYGQGHCRFGDKCRFSHDSAVAKQSARTQDACLDHSRHSLPDSLPSPSSGRPREEISCHAWRAGTCTRGSKCWFNHDIDVQKTKLESENVFSQLVNGCIVTYSAGLKVPNLITGFETCTLRVQNLPADEDDIYDLLVDQGIDIHRSHVEIKKKSGLAEAHIVTDIATGEALTSDLDGAEFQEETLVVEMTTTNCSEGMSAKVRQGSEVLTISWRGPSARYIAEFADIATANAKVRELRNFVYDGRRIKVQMNAQPRGRFVPNLRRNAIRINNLPESVTDEDVIRLTNALSAERLPVCGGLTREQISRIRNDIKQAVPGALRDFDPPRSTCTMGGVLSVRAHFSSWNEAHIAYTHLSDKRYGNQPVWLRLPDPMHFRLIIPAAQYKAQKSQWDSLLGSIKDRNACALNVQKSGEVVFIRLSGSVKEAMGALKVRVENLARGNKVQGWHRALCVPNSPFVRRVHSQTGAYLRADRKRQVLKVYGMPGAIDHARELIKGELERLASLDYTVTIPSHSVRFFVQEGVQQLKDTFGEDNVRLVTSSRKLTVSGSEEARHALDRLIHSRKGSSDLPNTARGDHACPVCYDTASSPHQLACGHTYCIACLRHFILSAPESDQLPLVCLGDEAQCRIPIPIPTIRHFLPPGSFNRLLEAAFDAHITKHTKKFKHCKTPDCTQIYRAARRGATPQTLNCPSCFSEVCNACHEDAHDGLSCAESQVQRNPAEQERLNEVWIASQGGRVKKCPQCSVPIERLEGCNHMTCRCGAHICWQCMRIFTAKTIYGHMRTAHGTIFDDEIPETPVNIAADIGITVDITEQQELFRGFEERYNAELAERARVAERRERRQRREAEGQERRRGEQHFNERYRAQQDFQSHQGGCGCTIM